MASVTTIGFDMDYTLAEYHTTVEELAIRLTIERLVSEKNYPKEILNLSYDPEFAIRGLTLDKKTGNLLKMDTHRHISHALHGFRPLSKSERRELYRHERIRMSAKRFALVDTLFAVPEAWLYAALIDLFETQTGRPLPRARYRNIYTDIRHAIDRVHADQSLKRIICADLSTYIRKDPELPKTLHQLRSAGKRLFVMTNSYGPYSNAVMTYLLDGMRPDYPSWRDYFDVIVVGARKPTFFTQGTPLYRLDDNLEPVEETITALDSDTIYQGGNLRQFEQFLDASGDEILYVGDHLYGDILRSKKTCMWRTAMIVPELEHELEVTERHAEDFAQRNALEAHRAQIDRELSQQHQLYDSLTEFTTRQTSEFPPDEQKALEHARTLTLRNINRLKKALRNCLTHAWTLNDRLAAAYNPHWGMLFKARTEHSLFGGQIETYACLYTSRVTNLLSYSPFQYFRTPRDRLPHEHLLMDPSSDPDRRDD